MAHRKPTAPQSQPGPALSGSRPAGAPQRAGGSPVGEAPANEGAPAGRGETEVPQKATRRRFTAAYKERILKELDACEPRSGRIGAILRREGLYSSTVQAWREARQRGGKEALGSKKRGPAPGTQDNPSRKDCERLQRENERLRRQLDQARLIIDIQKKLSRLLGIPLNSDPNGEKK